MKSKLSLDTNCVPKFNLGTRIKGAWLVAAGFSLRRLKPAATSYLIIL
jgi:hypothetical protein